MKIGDMELNDLIEAIQPLFTQSELRVTELLSDRMDEGFEAVDMEFKFVRQEMTAEFKSVRQEFEDSIAAVRQEMTDGLSAVRQEMKDGFRGVGVAIGELGDYIDEENKLLNKRLTKLEKHPT